MSAQLFKNISYLINRSGYSFQRNKNNSLKSKTCLAHEISMKNDSY